MKVIILAAGEGKRLRPLTNKKPKCMIELFGKSLLQYQIDVFRSCKINDISVVTGYKNEMINISNVKFFKNTNFDKTNMVETLFCASKELNDDVIISYGDIIFEKTVLEKLIQSKYDISVIIDLNWKKYWHQRFDDPLKDAESLVLDKNGFIQNIGQKTSNYEKIQGQYIGLMKFQSKGIDYLKDFYQQAKIASISGKNPLNQNLSFSQSYMTDLLQGMIDKGHRIMSIPIQGGWLELDSISDYELYNKKFLNGTLSNLIRI